MKYGRLLIFGLLVIGLLAFALFVRFEPGASATLWRLSRGGQSLLPFVLTGALIDSLNPCAFAILLVTIAFLFSLNRLRKNIFAIGLAYITGLFLVYLLIGFGLLQTLHLFNTPHFMAKVGAILLFLLGAFNVTGALWPNFPLRPRLPAFARRPIGPFIEQASLPAALALGGLVGLCEFPCTGGPYLAILGLLHDKATYLSGLLYLVFYNLVFILPLLLILFLATDRTLLERLQGFKRRSKQAAYLIAGLAMIGLALLIWRL